MYAWVLHHDDRWSFIALYVALAVVLSMWISLFWLVALVGVHYFFEYVRQGAAGASGLERANLALWEVKLDVALVLFALALSLYIEVVLGVLGIQAAARAGAAANASVRAGSRALGWERAIRGVLLTVDDAAQVGRVLGRNRAQEVASPANAPASMTATAVMSSSSGDPGAGVTAARQGVTGRTTPARATLPAVPRSDGWSGRWGVGDRVAVGLAVACSVLILGAPILVGGTMADAVRVMLVELHPFPR